MRFFQEEQPIILVFWSLKLGQMHNLVNLFHPMSEDTFSAPGRTGLWALLLYT